MDALRQNLRYALRGLIRRPVFAAVAILSLALGVGANASIFSVVNALVLRPLPGIPEQGRVVEIGRGRDGSGFDTFAYPDFLDLRASAGPLEEVAAYDFVSLGLSRDGVGRRVMGMFVSANYFEVLGLRPALGRFFLPEEDRGVGQHAVAVVSHGFWQERLGGDPDAVGSTIRLNREPFTVVGVTPEEFRGHTTGVAPRVWVPIMQVTSMGYSAELFQQRGSNWFSVLGRLGAAATTGEARAQVRTVFERLAAEHPATNARRTGHVQPLGPVPAAGRGPVKAFLGLLTGFALLILVITCANVAGMLAARGATREKEIAVRMSLGAGRRRVVGQLLLEALLLFALGGGAGVLLALWLLDAVSLASLPIPIPLELDFSLDGRVVGYTLLVTAATGLFFGLLPALRSTRIDVAGRLKNESHGATARSGLRRVLVAGQVALSLALLAGGGLFVRSLDRASNVETGFDARGAYTTSLDLTLEGVEDPERGRAFYAELLERVRGLPWVDAAGLSVDLPLDLGRHSTSVYLEGGEDSGEAERSVEFNVVSPGYFESLGIELRRGRGFRASDREDSEPVAVVSRTFVKEIWPEGDPVGRRFRFGRPDGPLATVVGVVDDVKNQFLTESASPFVYVPFAQRYRSHSELVVRTRRDPASVAGALRQALLDFDPGLSLAPVVSLERSTRLGILPQRVGAWVAGSLGILALVLSGMGIYGMVAFAVSRRTREFGVRMALGAAANDIVSLVVRGGLRLALPGLLVGAVLALALGRLLRSFLLGVSPLDPLALVGTALLLMAVVLVGAVVPAWRAARIEPVQALRYE